MEKQRRRIAGSQKCSDSKKSENNEAYVQRNEQIWVLIHLIRRVVYL